MAFWTALVGGLLSGGALVLALVQGWLGPPRERNVFCECLGPGLVAQPANTWSNLGFITVGLLIGLCADRDLRAPRAANPLTTTRFLPALFALVVLLLGPGSMALHATNSWWGGRLDVMSMYAMASFPLAYRVARHKGDDVRWFLGSYAAVFGLLLVILFAWQPQEITFASVLFAIALAEGHAIRRGPWRAEPRWLLGSLLLVAVAFAIWIPSRTGGPLCDPESLLQGHAVWHLLCALAAGSLYLYLRSEESRPELG